MVCSNEFPRYFTNPDGYDSDAVYVRHDSDQDTVVVTMKGEREPNHGWPLRCTLIMLAEGLAVELTKEEAAAMVQI